MGCKSLYLLPQYRRKHSRKEQNVFGFFGLNATLVLQFDKTHGIFSDTSVPKNRLKPTISYVNSILTEALYMCASHFLGALLEIDISTGITRS